MTKLAETLIHLRKRNKLTQKELATYFKVAESTISGYENGVREPNLEMLVRIADFFNVSTDFLLGREFNKTGSHLIDIKFEQKLKEKVELRMNEFVKNQVESTVKQIVMEIKKEMK